ncbi:hypothetical protein COCON_G00010090 [Conger conger]|uniref:Uncharacterized protein n=1 Tax=Conger conger TaxID=82655 RepID=A0A9Q1E2C2_CONCO|nr:hypothetical protein COCON_G00010090 [Conger conger]
MDHRVTSSRSLSMCPRGPSAVPPHQSRPPLVAVVKKTPWCTSSDPLFPLLLPNPGGEDFLPN